MDMKSLSCVDEQTLNSGGGSEGDGGNNSIPESGNGGSIWVSCELWYFPGGLTNGQYYLERNCNFYRVP